MSRLLASLTQEKMGHAGSLPSGKAPRSWFTWRPRARQARGLPCNSHIQQTMIMKRAACSRRHWQCTQHAADAAWHIVRPVRMGAQPGIETKLI